ncbi:hypothetical protein chiPu_0011301 [Chiloscyllium punctatum]|uniref:Uncharacterized protein n=1 Tax=Chiloscyllium punctatum TaxID=137246 RepID=A0A401SR26_CHIPU|nr:hypothetical protein [Chiloscyllium punctatum]
MSRFNSHPVFSGVLFAAVAPPSFPEKFCKPTKRLELEIYMYFFSKKAHVGGSSERERKRERAQADLINIHCCKTGGLRSNFERFYWLRFTLRVAEAVQPLLFVCGNKGITGKDLGSSC